MRSRVRPWLAAAFGLIHGFGFAAVLREIGLPPGALTWSLAGFNLGVEVGQLAAVGVPGQVQVHRAVAGGLQQAGQGQRLARRNAARALALRHRGDESHSQRVRLLLNLRVQRAAEAADKRLVRAWRIVVVIEIPQELRESNSLRAAAGAAEARDLDPDERHRWRQQHARPRIDDLKHWLAALRSRFSPRSCFRG